MVRYSEDGTLEKYVYGNGLIASSETRESHSPKYRTYLYDLRGSVTFTLDSSANITSEYRYSTYGTRGVVKGNTTSELGYCARDGVLTEVTGLLYMRARYYYPDLMRFINQDIVTGDISNGGSLNRYTYVEGNPATMIDPFGLCASKTEEYSLKDKLTWTELYNMKTYAVPGTYYDAEAVFDELWRSEDKKYANAEYIYIYLKYRGWSKEAICAVLGNMEIESYINPAMWEVQDNENKGYGLLQTTKYKDDYRLISQLKESIGSYAGNQQDSVGPNEINEFAKTNPNLLIRIELDYFIEESQNKPGRKYWNSTSNVNVLEEYRNISFDDFVTSKGKPYDLAIAFWAIYERPLNPNEYDQRGQLANDWYNVHFKGWD